MENIVTTQEICDFLNERLNYERKDLEEKLYGKSYHDIRQATYNSGLNEGKLVKGSNAIYMENKIFKNSDVGCVNVDSDGNINIIKIDMSCTSKRRNLYKGTENMNEELATRFLGKRLIHV